MVTSRTFALAQRFERVVGDVGLCQLLGCAAQNPCDVHSDVSDAHHSDTLGGEVELMVPVVGVAVEPGHEFGGGVASWEILAGDPHAPVPSQRRWKSRSDESAG